jgi:two-component SAPR family response regulator
MTLRCIAVDDEPLALDLLEDNIRQVPFLDLKAKCSNAMEATEILRREQIDLIFLDIQMPGITGLQFIQSFPSSPW